VSLTSGSVINALSFWSLIDLFCCSLLLFMPLPVALLPRPLDSPRPKISGQLQKQSASESGRRRTERPRAKFKFKFVPPFGHKRFGVRGRTIKGAAAGWESWNSTHLCDLWHGALLSAGG